MESGASGLINLGLTEAISALAFEPWVGASSARRSGLFPLIVGESHYGDPSTEITINVIQENAIEGRMAFFTRCASLITGLPGDWLQPEEFWRRVAFANLAQETVDGPRSPSQWSALLAGAAPLAEAVERVQPTHIVCLGNKVWEALSESGHLDHRPFSATEGVDICDSGMLNGRPLFWTYHPSSFGYFNWQEGSRCLGSFLKETGVDREEINEFIQFGLASPPPSYLLAGFDQ
ncbi:hypothetical protein [Roseitalea porphyridii]|uniref:Uracil-DNA glycosylase-like domain-containing protein n=1 Tax=Roseitalea porphyridii TaxID=1852022 RepID=A0A4P6V317_9HYPH|nr:hypothetical protein [Roseitalea porphyridii]QBK31283.1 hypothetical protein E0E05_12135 [Roseitalea porphyridii]